MRPACMVLTAISTAQFVIAGLDRAVHLFQMIQILSACADGDTRGQAHVWRSRPRRESQRRV